MQEMSLYPGIRENALTRIPAKPTYTVLFDGDKLPLNTDTLQIITVQSVEEAARYFMLLGDFCELRISPEYQYAHPGLYEKILVHSNTINANEAPFDTETAACLMQKLPLDIKNLLKSPLALKEGEKMPPPINKGLVHKTNEANVLISEPCSIGWLHHFNMFQETAELTDHTSGHVEGMLVIEATRQASTATAHLQGMPPDGKIALLNYTTNFFNFLDRNAPIILRVYSSFTASETSEDRVAPIYIQVMQWGKVCAEAKPKGFAYMHNQCYQQKSMLIEKIASRSKLQFDTKLNRILESESAD